MYRLAARTRLATHTRLAIDYPHCRTEIRTMSETKSDPEDAITKEEITGTAAAPEPSSVGGSRGTKRNAFTELMAPKPKKQPEPPTLASTRGAFTGGFKARDGLGAYTADPASFPAGRVIYHNTSFVVINDLYPKSTVHVLLLPRSPRSRLHPFDAFEDAEFLASVQAETARLKHLVAKELQRQYGRFSKQEKQREAVLNGDVEWDDEAPLPVGRDWEKELLVGVHAHPSMNDLHVHVLSRDMVSECMRHRKHYQSFNTPFLVDIAEFPLAANDPRRRPGHAGYLDEDLRCWRCKRNFGNQFKKLKEHLADELETWKKL
ncbi:HIT domain-containing protein [Xylaria cubensis]|nr:HIT domain-containing protein [Xylaria cubensis]